MRRQLSLILTLTAWLLATGSHWDLVQTFALGRMFASYAQSMSFTQAAQKNVFARGPVRNLRNRHRGQTAAGRRWRQSFRHQGAG